MPRKSKRLAIKQTKQPQQKHLLFPIEPAHTLNTNNNNNSQQSSISSQDTMNIELSTEQLELTLNPDHNFIPSCYLSQPKTSSQETTPLQVEGPLAITSPSSSQVVPQNDWRFIDPSVPSSSTNPDIYNPDMFIGLQDLVDTSVTYTPQSTPPPSPQASLVNERSSTVANTSQANDPLPIDTENDLFQGVDFDQLLSIGSPADLDPLLDTVDIVSLLSEGPDVSSEAIEISVSASPAPETEPEPEPEPESELAFEAEMEPVPGPSSQASTSTKYSRATKSGRGRKRKLTSEDKDLRKREQNANAAKRYRERNKKQQESIFAEKEQLELQVEETRRKAQAKMNQRNLMLIMLYELAQDKGCLKNFTFPPWMERFYTEYKQNN